MKNPDVLDQAQEITDFMREKTVDLIRQHAKPEQHPDFDGKHCVEPDCEVEIPDERLAMGKVRCVPCASRIEQKNRGSKAVW